MKGACIGTGLLSSVISNSAPTTATTRSASNSSSGPSSVISSVAASASLPTSALASRCDTGSIGPATGTPRACSPHRPRSWIVVSMPGLMTRMFMGTSDFRLQTFVRRSIDRIELDGIAGLHQERLGSRRVERLHRRAADQLPPSWRLGRIDAGLRAGDANRAERYAYPRRRVARHRDPIVDDPHVREA